MRVGGVRLSWGVEGKREVSLAALVGFVHKPGDHTQRESTHSWMACWPPGWGWGAESKGEGLYSCLGGRVGGLGGAQRELL